MQPRISDRFWWRCCWQDKGYPIYFELSTTKYIIDIHWQSTSLRKNILLLEGCSVSTTWSIFQSCLPKLQALTWSTLLSRSNRGFSTEAPLGSKDLRPPAQLLKDRLLQATAKKIKDHQAQEAACSDCQPSQQVDGGNFLASLWERISGAKARPAGTQVLQLLNGPAGPSHPWASKLCTRCAAALAAGVPPRSARHEAPKSAWEVQLSGSFNK